MERLRRSLKLSRKEVDELLGIERRAAANLVEVPQDVLTRWCQELGNPSKTARVSSEIFSSYLCDPISEALGHLKGETQKVAALLNKEVNPLLVEGDDIRVPLNFYSGVFNNLVHCLRNSVDHGVEPGDEREELGKPRKATLGIHISSAQVSRTRSELIIEIYDDGRGLNEAKLRTKLGPQASREEVMMSIFEDGFSTKEEVTTISGRGVGMSALRAEVQKLGGKVEVESRPGQGLKIILRLPKISSLSDYVGHLMFRSKAS